MNPVLISIGPLEIKWYSFLILLAVAIGITLFMKEGKRFKISSDFLFNLAFWVIVFGIIGARIYYVIFNWADYSNNLVSVLKIWNGGLAIHGGLIAGFITMFVYCYKYKVNVLKISDLAVVPVILGQAIGRWGNFFNSEAHGAVTSLSHLKELHIPEFIINGMEIGGLYYHPTFFYESLWCIIGFIILLIVRRIKYIKVGQLTCIYLMWYSFGRFFIESMRTDSLMLGGFKVAQIISIVLFVIALLVLMVLSRKGKFEDLYNSENQNIRF
ncbi:MAG: prolipoprotein diacylglyceryl transferase [Bacilli bacterium]|nr:prolipoprotein diacylglyceryl transferase [Bacilli bacterium]